MNPPPENTVKQRGDDPIVIVQRQYVRIGCSCLLCGARTWLLIAMRRLSGKTGERKWRCRECGSVGKLGVGT